MFKQVLKPVVCQTSVSHSETDCLCTVSCFPVWAVSRPEGKLLLHGPHPSAEALCDAIGDHSFLTRPLSLLLFRCRVGRAGMPPPVSLWPPRRGRSSSPSRPCRIATRSSGELISGTFKASRLRVLVFLLCVAYSPRTCMLRGCSCFYVCICM